MQTKLLENLKEGTLVEYGIHGGFDINSFLGVFELGEDTIKPSQEMRYYCDNHFTRIGYLYQPESFNQHRIICRQIENGNPKGSDRIKYSRLDFIALLEEAQNEAEFLELLKENNKADLRGIPIEYSVYGNREAGYLIHCNLEKGIATIAEQHNNRDGIEGFSKLKDLALNCITMQSLKRSDIELSLS